MRGGVTNAVSDISASEIESLQMLEIDIGGERHRFWDVRLPDGGSVFFREIQR